MTTLTNSINANSTTPLLPIQGGTGISSPTAHGVMISEGASAVTPIVLTAGQVLIGTTAGDPAGATLTAGSNVSITSASGSITINASATASPVSWNVVTTNTNLVKNNGYFSNSVAPLTFELPATAAVGDTYYVWGVLGSWVISQNAGQNIQLFIGQTTVGTGGALTSNNATGGDYVEIVCMTANTFFMATMLEGSATTS